MELLRKLDFPWAPRLRALPQSLTGRWWAVSILIAAAVVCAVLLPRPARDADEPLLEDRSCSAREIARMTAALQKHGLREARVSERQILVPRGCKQQYLAVLDRENALPVEFDDAQDQLPASSNPFASSRQVDAALRTADQKKLARIVAGMKGIESASVQYTTIKKPGFPPTEEMRAMVAVRAIGVRPLEYEEIEAIRDTVTGYVAGLERRHVTVTDLNAVRAYVGHEEAGWPHAGGFAAAKRALEQEYQHKIEARLSAYRGAVVGVHVEFAEPPAPKADVPPAASPRPGAVCVSIDLPRSYFRRAWCERTGNAPSTPVPLVELSSLEQESQQTVKQAVLGLLPAPVLGGTSPQVTVTVYEDVPAGELPRGGDAARFLVWRPELAVALGIMAAIAIGAFVWRTGRAAPDAAEAGAPPETAPPQSAVDQPGPAEAAPPTAEWDALRTRLNAAVKSRPETAAGVLKQWLNDAA
jgi:flagellar biosynthesis/type III secretory pathway M-ring protein FliF/YscJ